LCLFCDRDRLRSSAVQEKSCLGLG